MLFSTIIAPLLALLAGCAETEELSSTSATATSMNETGEIEANYPNGFFAISLFFEGYAKEADTCLDLSLDNLYVDMSKDGSVQPTATYPCDGETLMIAPDEPGEWTISVKTVPFTSSAEGTYGESYGYLSEAKVDQITELIIQVVCYDDDGNGCDNTP